MKLNTNIFGEAGSLPPLLIVHGLFGSARNWGVIAKRLSDERQVITVDMRNHAQSGWADSHSYFDLAADLAETLEQIAGPVDLLGHSMGGKAAMVLALRKPALVRRLVVADIAPVAYSHTQMGPIQAMRGVDLGAINTRQDAAHQMTGIEDALKPFLLQSLLVAGQLLTQTLVAARDEHVERRCERTRNARIVDAVRSIDVRYARCAHVRRKLARAAFARLARSALRAIAPIQRK